MSDVLRKAMSGSMLAKYSPTQPRDDRGRWTSSGLARLKKLLPDCAIDDRLPKEYLDGIADGIAIVKQLNPEVLRHVKVIQKQTLQGNSAARTEHSGQGVSIEYDPDAIRYAFESHKNSSIAWASDSLQEAVSRVTIHEMGHVLAMSAEAAISNGQHGLDRNNLAVVSNKTLLMQPAFDQQLDDWARARDINDKGGPADPSPYALANPGEHWAESYLAYAIGAGALAGPHFRQLLAVYTDLDRNGAPSREWAQSKMQARFERARRRALEKASFSHEDTFEGSLVWGKSVGTHIEKYSKDQPRDDRGRWTRVGIAPHTRSDEVWQSMLSEQDRTMEDPEKAHPERYQPNKGFGVSLKPGEVETVEYHSYDTVPMVQDITRITGPIDASTPLVSHPRYGSMMRVPGSVRPREFVYRVVSEEDYQQIKQRGTIASDGRMNLGDEGTVYSADSTGEFYMPPKDQKARIMRVRVHPSMREDKADNYIKTHEPVPASYIDAVSPPLVFVQSGPSVDRWGEPRVVGSWYTEGEIEKYDPNQPRDRQGRWTSGSGGSGQAVGYPDLSVSEATTQLRELLPGTDRVYRMKVRNADGGISFRPEPHSSISGLQHLTGVERGALVSGVRKMRDRWGDRLDRIIQFDIDSHTLVTRTGEKTMSEAAGLTWIGENFPYKDAPDQNIPYGSTVMISALEMRKQTDAPTSMMGFETDSAARTESTVVHELAHAVHFDMLAERIGEGSRELGYKKLLQGDGSGYASRAFEGFFPQHSFSGAPLLPLPDHSIRSGPLPSKYARTNYMEAFAELETAQVLKHPKRTGNAEWEHWREKVGKAERPTVFRHPDGGIVILDDFGHVGSVEKYDPNQPRDEKGRWTRGGGRVVPQYGAEYQPKRGDKPTIDPTRSENLPEQDLRELHTRFESVFHVTQAEMVTNLLSTYQRTSASRREEGARWYDDAHDAAQSIATRDGRPLDQTVGIIAALSPLNAWEGNVEGADYLSRAVREDWKIPDLDVNFTKKGKNEEPVTKTLQEWADIELGSDTLSLAGHRLSELTPKQTATAIKAMSQLGYIHDPSLPEAWMVRGNLGIAWSCGLINISKAVQISRGANPADILNGHKVRSFYNNILDPGQADSVTIDTHALGAAVGRTLKAGDREIKLGFNAPKMIQHSLVGTYPLVADAYRQAAEIVGLKPHQFQAIVWLEQQGVALEAVKQAKRDRLAANRRKRSGG